MKPHIFKRLYITQYTYLPILCFIFSFTFEKWNVNDIKYGNWKLEKCKRRNYKDYFCYVSMDQTNRSIPAANPSSLSVIICQGNKIYMKLKFIWNLISWYWLIRKIRVTDVLFVMEKKIWFPFRHINLTFAVTFSSSLQDIINIGVTCSSRHCTTFISNIFPYRLEFSRCSHVSR